MKGAWALVVVLLAGVGCGSKADSQSEPIGSPCTNSQHCGTAPYECILTSATAYKGGYCTRPCATDGDCPADSLCLPAGGCRRRCTDDANCRVDQGYACITAPMGAYCDSAPATTVDDLGP